MPHSLPWKTLCIGALFLGAGCGGGSAGQRSPETDDPPGAATPTPSAAPSPTAAAACSGPFDDGEVFVTVLELRGAPSRNGLGNTPSIPFRTSKRALVRAHLGRVEILDFAGDGAPEWRGPIFFSSPGVAWSWSAGYLVPESPFPRGAVLLRSDDAGVTWQDVSPIAGAERRLDLVVDEKSAFGWTLGTYESRASFGTPGPYVFAGSVATDRWQQVDEVPVGEWLKPVWMGLGTRGGRTEVVRWWPDLELYDVSNPDAVTVSRIDADAGFQPTEYATYGDRGWIAGMLGGQPQILVSSADGAWDAVPVADVAQGSISWLDFADAEHGFACGWEQAAADPAGARFCVFSDDGGWSWSRGDVPPGLVPLHVARSRCLAGGVATASSPWWSPSPRAEVLTTFDGGRTWSSEALPRLGDSMQTGPTLANSRTGESTRGVPVPAASPIVLPPPAPGIPEDAAGPILWAAGDSVAYGPAILGLLLRSNDGGRTWIEALGRPGGSFRDVDFVDRRTGWVVGGGRILRTDDGGASFVDQTGHFEGLLSEARVVSAADARHAIVVGQGLPAGADYSRDIVLFTNDGGASWRVADLPATGEFPPVLGDACVSTGGAGVLIVDSRGATTADAGATWTFDAGFPNGPGFQFDDPGLVCSGRSDLWILAEGRADDTLWHSPNGGRTWTDRTRQVGLIASSRARTVGAFLPSGDGWLVVEESDGVAVLVKTKDGGRTWAELPGPFAPLQHAETMAFVENGTGVVLTTDRAAYRTTDGGASWSAGALPGGFMPLAMDAVP